MPTEDYCEGLLRRLADPAYAADYLLACLQDGDPYVLSIALEDLEESAEEAAFQRLSVDAILQEEERGEEEERCEKEKA